MNSKPAWATHVFMWVETEISRTEQGVGLDYVQGFKTSTVRR